jgi:hypothetical protein
MNEDVRATYTRVKSGLRILKILYWSIEDLVYKLGVLNIYEIPVVINNFNRLSSLRQLTKFLEDCGFKNIIILDNNSTYPPLLEYYERSNNKVIRCGHNYGHLALWKSGLYDQIKWNYFVYTDSDVLPIDECPKNFIEHFKSILDKEWRLDKVGFGIKIDDLPDSFSLKNEVVEYESNYWKKEVMPNVYEAPIDTTFALYKPLTNLKSGHSHTLKSFRIGSPYLIRHLPWYVDSECLSDEEKYYMQTSNKSSSLASHWRGEGDVY